MASRVDALADAYARHVGLPWGLGRVGFMTRSGTRAPREAEQAAGLLCSPSRKTLAVVEIGPQSGERLLAPSRLTALR